MAHGSSVGRWWSDADTKEAQEDIYGSMKSDIGAWDTDSIQSFLEEYNRTGNINSIPEGRLRDVVQYSSEYLSGTKGEVKAKGEIADINIIKAETTLESIEKKTSEWLEGNLQKAYRGGEQMSQKTGLEGPTREFDQTRDEIKTQKELRDYEAVIGAQNVDLAQWGKRLTTSSGQKDIASAETRRVQAINQIKDLMYDIETSEFQNEFG